MAKVYQWGILGAGNIAKSFARGLKALPEAKLAAVGSRDAAKAEAFGGEFEIPKCYGSYEALLADAELDAIYIATPHPLHRPHTLMALDAGKAVLCEKPMAVNEAEGRAMAEAARERGRFLMEAMWTRFLPAIAQVREWLAAGAIGDPRVVTADFGFRCGWNPEGRLLNPALAGGSLLDVGVYCVSFASMVFGPPSHATGLAAIGETGVDEQAAFVLGFDHGRLAVLSSAVRTNTPQEARIDGTEGRIRIPAFWHATQATLEVNGREPETVELPFLSNGYEYQAREVMQCLAEGRTESDVLPLDETLAVLHTLDDLRADWGLRYPME